MSKFVVPAAVAALIAVAPMAAFARHDATYNYPGTVKSINASAGSVTLDDGSTYQLGYAALQSQLKPGAQVNLQVKSVNGSDTVTGFSAAM